MFLLEPIMNVSITFLSRFSSLFLNMLAKYHYKVQQEAQAVNRVHRIGQKRPTFVHKYVVNGTIEKRIHSMTEAVFENTRGGVCEASL